MTACIFRLSGFGGGSPRSEAGSGQPESAADAAGEGPSAHRSEKRRSREPGPPTGAAAHQAAAQDGASARGSEGNSGRQAGGAGEAEWRTAAGRGGADPGCQRAGETRGGTVSMVLLLFTRAGVQFVV